MLSNRTAEGLILNLYLMLAEKSKKYDLSELGFGNEDYQVLRV
jgi:hypothetical protein